MSLKYLAAHVSRYAAVVLEDRQNAEILARSDKTDITRRLGAGSNRNGILRHEIHCGATGRWRRPLPAAV